MIKPKEIIRSRRKTIALVIDNDGELIVRAPFFATDNDISQFIIEKQDWIIEKSLDMKKKLLNYPPLTFTDGETIPYLGNACVIHRGFVKNVYCDGESFLIPETEDARDKLILWFKKEAARILKERVSHYAELMEVEPCGVRITSAKTRWGSCSYKNHLNFSWRLIMCPGEVIDYVVVHELCHIYHKDHSKNFWKSVKEVDVSYIEHEKWLRDNQRLMEVI